MNEGSAGQNIGITTTDPVFLERGNVICLPGQEPYLTDTFKADVFWMNKKELLRGEKIILKCATQETICWLEKIEERMNSSSLDIIEKLLKSFDNIL